MTVLDYSFARPSPPLMRQHATGVIRYLSTDPAKNLSASERDALFAADLAIGLVWETTAHMMDGGYLAGYANALTANAQADALGAPLTVVIYFANDQNAFDERHANYLLGAKDASRRPVGVYGNTAIVDWAHGAGISYGWKVATWGPPTPNAQLVQEPNISTPIPGTDVNSVHGDWGAWAPVAAPAPVATHGPTGLDLLHAAYTFHGQPYSTAPGRTQPSSGWKDCSGLWYAAFLLLGITPGGSVSTTEELWAISTGGRYVTKEYAMSTPGVGCSIWGTGARGHIGCSVGDGRVFETPSAEGHSAGWSPFDRNRWERYFTWGVLDHHGNAAPNQGDDVHCMYILSVGNRQGWVLSDGSGYVWANDRLMADHRARQKFAPALFVETYITDPKVAEQIAARADQ